MRNLTIASAGGKINFQVTSLSQAIQVLPLALLFNALVLCHHRGLQPLLCHWLLLCCGLLKISSPDQTHVTKTRLIGNMMMMPLAGPPLLLLPLLHPCNTPLSRMMIA
jgi:hypothetical protein